MSDPTHDNGELPKRLDEAKAADREWEVVIGMVRIGEEQTMRLLDEMQDEGTDRRLLAVARTQIELGYAALYKAIRQPPRMSDEEMAQAAAAAEALKAAMRR